MPYIYKIENKINHKVCIGKTVHTIERRWQKHRNDFESCRKPNKLLYKAMEKDGIENFEISCVEEIKDVKLLPERERYWIKYYDSIANGYNCTIGGEGYLHYDYDFIWELWKCGYSIKQISAFFGCNDYVVRTVLDIHNVSTEERIERSMIDQINSHKPYSRKVNQIDIETGKIIKTFNSVSEAASNVGGDCSRLCKKCKAKKSAYGYKWEYADASYVKKDFSPKRVCQLDLKTGKIINVFESISEAARSVNGDSSYISSVCRGKHRSSKGFGWKFEQDAV